MYRNPTLLKAIAAFIAVNIFIECIFPFAAFALTAGPGSPEFSSFEPVATTDMVNMFSGDFNYNLPVLEIPGADGGGYAMSLSYHSGASSEEEASWVGFGWTLNPGAINRNTRGFPDDYKDAEVTQYNKTPANWSAGMTKSLGFEIFSADQSGSKKGNKDMGLSASASLRYNNNQGFSVTKGFGVDVKGLANIGMNAGAEGASYSAGINVANILNKAKNKLAGKDNKDKSKEVEKSSKYIDRLKKKYKNKGSAQINQSYGSSYGITSFSEAVRNTAIGKYVGNSYNWSAGVVAQAAGIGVQTGFSGSFSVQNPHEKIDLRVNGYLYNQPLNNSNDKLLSDYYVEKGNPFSKRDIYLGIPFNNADNYMVSGEGVTGGFRFYPNEVGHFYPNFTENKTSIYQLGYELTLGQEVGVGLDFGYGSQRYKVSNWHNDGDASLYQYSGSTNGIFRFSNDLGGSISYDNSSDLRRAQAVSTSSVPGTKSVRIDVPEELQNVGSIYPDSKERSTSSYIYYNKTGAFKQNNRLNKNLAKSLSGSQISAIIQAVELKNDGIAEIGIINENGVRNIYGLPVFNRNETNLQIDVNGASIVNKSLAYKQVNIGSNYDVNFINHKTVVGEVRKQPYATSYQMTQILTPDYVDVNNNGPDNSDFGGWTQFYYHKKYGFGSSWYNWSTPYTGLSYEKNEISNVRDDMGTIMCGQKEVVYLKAIETKTHIAYFVTNKSDTTRFGAPAESRNYLSGTGNTRKDGLGAASPSQSTGGATAKSANDLEYLEKIVLFAKRRPGKPIKTIRFAYDYSLVKNLPNNIEGNYPSSSNSNSSGKLTLKKVWFEYEDIVNKQTSPFEFEYQYKNLQQFPDYIKDKYSNELAFCNKYSELAQNPNYSPFLLDPWGNAQQYGQERKNLMIPWVYQGPVPAKNVPGLTNWAPAKQNAQVQQSFDPACWQLKQIKLPSGGEILIEYEQKDYSFVQDRKPMAMARLLEVHNELTPDGQKYGTSPSYVIDVRDLGLDPSNQSQVEEQAGLINKYFAEEKLYFKFLYALNQAAGKASLDNCMSEYITGYTTLGNAEVITKGGENYIKIILEGTNSSGGEYTNVPRQACFDYYVTHRNGSNSYSCQDNLSSFDNKIQNDIKTNQGVVKKFDTMIPLFNKMKDEFIVKNTYDYTFAQKRTTVGSDLNLGLSFLKLPMLKPKKGGGIRVKRLMMYDPGIETGDAALYGQEYLYQGIEELSDGSVRAISSGVATNEPSGAREENPLVTFLPRKNQSWYSRITSGEDKEQTEGPIGETLLPGASVGHSRVVVKNIHGGPTGTGFSVTEYNTVKEYPFDGLYAGGDPSDYDLSNNSQGVAYSDLSDSRKRDYLVIPAGLFYYEVNKEWVTQGYRFIVNNMHGTVKRTASYAGDYKISDSWGSPLTRTYSRNQLDAPAKVSEDIYEYFKPGEKIQVMDETGKCRKTLPGKEMDITMEAKAISESTMDVSLEVDLVFVLPTFIVKPTAALSFSYTDRGLSTHVTSKVIRYPAILKKITSFQSGISSTTENLAFNQMTGKPVLVKTYDSYDGIKLNGNKHDGSMYTLDLPAAWYYPDMGPAAVDPENANRLSVSAGKIISYGAAGNPIKPNGFNDLTGSFPVISALFQAYSRDWFNGTDEIDNLIKQQYGLQVTNSTVLDDLNKIYRPSASYVYRGNVKTATDTVMGVATAGLLQTFSMFNPTATTNLNWIRTSRTTKYSPNGNAIEDANALNIYSAALMGYENTLPVMVAQNAKYGSIYFDDFEKNGLTGPSHSGSRRQEISSGSTFAINNKILWDTGSKNGAEIKVWAKNASPTSPNTQLDIKAKIGGYDIFPFKLIASSGEWGLYEATIPSTKLMTTGVLNITLESTSSIYIDDLRFQPQDAQGICYVYDPQSLKLLCQFDDQHFGLFYQYNAEGKLIRKLIETEKGIFTIQETQYHTPKRPVQ